MEIVRIFGSCLFSFKFGKVNEHQRLFNCWNDPEFLEDFFERNKDDLKNPLWNNITPDDAVLKTIQDANSLESRLKQIAKNKRKHRELETLFRPLNDTQTGIVQFRKSKTRQNWLRLYALRIEKNTYVITGGAIKLTRYMQDRNHTTQELSKLDRCRNFLISENLSDTEGIIEAFEL